MKLRNISFRFPISRSVRYFLVSHGFRVVQAIAVLVALSFFLTGSRIVFIDRYGNRADIVTSIFVTIAIMEVLSAVNRRVVSAIDRRFFREAYDAESILTEMDEGTSTLSKSKPLAELAAEKISNALHPNNVSIFLEDGDSGAYVAAFSSDALTAGSASAVQLRSLVLPKDLGIINRLRKSKSLDLGEPRDQRSGLDGDSVPSDHESKTLRVVRSSLLIPITSNGRLHGLISSEPLPAAVRVGVWAAPAGTIAR
jgi:sigma-B regulation protein RsbU (phosphoserine phosphatase)